MSLNSSDFQIQGIIWYFFFPPFISLTQGSLTIEQVPFIVLENAMQIGMKNKFTWLLVFEFENMIQTIRIVVALKMKV